MASTKGMERPTGDAVQDRTVKNDPTGKVDSKTKELGKEWPREHKNKGSAQEAETGHPGTLGKDGGMPSEEVTPEDIGSIVEDGDNKLQALFDSYARQAKYLRPREFAEFASGYGVTLEGRTQLLKLLESNRDFVFHEKQDKRGAYWVLEAVADNLEFGDKEGLGRDIEEVGEHDLGGMDMGGIDPQADVEVPELGELGAEMGGDVHDMAGMGDLNGADHDLGMGDDPLQQLGMDFEHIGDDFGQIGHDFENVENIGGMGGEEMGGEGGMPCPGCDDAECPDCGYPNNDHGHMDGGDGPPDDDMFADSNVAAYQAEWHEQNGTMLTEDEGMPTYKVREGAPGEGGYEMESPKGKSISQHKASKDSGLPQEPSDTTKAGKEWPRKHSKQGTGSAQEEFPGYSHTGKAGDACDDGVEKKDKELDLKTKQTSTGGQFEVFKNGGAGNMSGGAGKMYENVQKLNRIVTEAITAMIKEAKFKPGTYAGTFIAHAGRYVHPREHTNLTEALVDAEELIQIFGNAVSLEVRYSDSHRGGDVRKIVQLPRITARGPIVSENKVLFRFPELARDFADILVENNKTCSAVTHNWGAAVSAKIPYAIAERAFNAIREGTETKI